METKPNTQQKTKKTFSPKVVKLLGSIKPSNDFDYKQSIGNALAKKHK
ncbi:hypothetical protein HDF24_01920 [Mucilaginibacter sp. X4EP1]|nr:hypothetical protein [Mucilaginibacter sp. X4EP1]MCS3811771.1 hypothetical protein [Mucilaginibacter sp. X4EP1]